MKSPAEQASGAHGSRYLGVVFAGGGSQRMGADKALLPWPIGEGSGEGRSSGQVPLFEAAARVLETLCHRVEISVGSGPPRAAIEDGPWSTFVDAERDAGPLAGLVAALGRCEALGYDGMLALACDMPLVTAREFTPLMARLDEGADVAMWTLMGDRGDRVDQPLVAAYARAAAAPARLALARGARRLVALGDEPYPLDSGGSPKPPRMDRVAAEENSSARLVNVNTPSDYDAAYAKISQHDLSLGGSPP